MDKMRFAAVAVLAASAFMLAACGGGGGGGESPAPVTPITPIQPATPTAATGSITSATGCTVPAGQSTCNGQAVYTTANTQNPRLNLDGTSVSTTASGTASFALTAGEHTLTVSDGGTTLATLPVSASCAEHSAADANKVCQPTAYHYPAFRLAVRSDIAHTLWAFDENGATKLKNSTGFEATNAVPEPVWNCGLYDLTLADNRPIASCTTPAAGNVRRVFPINPGTLELMKEYTGPLPAGAVLRDTFYGTFGDSPYASKDVGKKGMYVDEPGVGTFYFTNNDPQLRLTKDGFVTNKLVSSGRFQLLWRYGAK